MALQVTTASTGEPLSLADAKDHLRVSSTAEEILVESYLRAAREHVETYTRRALLNTTFQLTLDKFPRGDVIELPRSPLSGTSNVTVTYVPSTGGGDLTVASTKLIIDGESEPPRVILKGEESWAEETLEDANAVKVSFRAGYGGSSDVPEGIKHAIRLLVGHWHQNREAVVVGSINTPLKAAVDSLLGSYRVPDVP